MLWTTKLPTEDGFYWYREDAESAPRVAEWDSGMGTVAFTDTDIMLWRGADNAEVKHGA